MCRRGHFGVHVRRFCVRIRVRRNQSTSVRVRTYLWMGWGARMLNIRWWSRGCMTDSSQHHVAGEVETNKKAYSSGHITNVLITCCKKSVKHHFGFAKIVIVWLQFCYSLVRVSHGVRNLHTPWFGLIVCNMPAHTYYWFPFHRLWVASKWDWLVQTIVLYPSSMDRNGSQAQGHIHITWTKNIF